MIESGELMSSPARQPLLSHRRAQPGRRKPKTRVGGTRRRRRARRPPSSLYLAPHQHHKCAESRNLAPGRTRWPNRDPIAEGGGENTFRFIDNEPIPMIDVLGLFIFPAMVLPDRYVRPVLREEDVSFSEPIEYSAFRAAVCVLREIRKVSTWMINSESSDVASSSRYRDIDLYTTVRIQSRSHWFNLQADLFLNIYSAPRAWDFGNLKWINANGLNFDGIPVL